MEDEQTYLLEQLKCCEMEILVLHRKDMIDGVFKNLNRLVALSHMIYGGMTWIDAKYQTLLAFAYLEFKGTSYAVQAEHHGQLCDRLLDDRRNHFGKTSKSTWVDQSKIQENKKSLQLVCLLSQFTLSRAKMILQKEQKALQCANKAREIHRALHACNTSKEHVNYPATDQELKFLSPLLTPGGGFYPSMEQLEIRLDVLSGRLLSKRRDYGEAEGCLKRALASAIQLFGERSQKVIPILTALGHFSDQQSCEASQSSAMEYYRQAFEISSKVFLGEESVTSGLDLAGTVSRLATCRNALNWPSTKGEMEDILLKTINQLITFMSSPTEKVYNRSALNRVNAPSETEMRNLIDSVCNLQCILIRQYLNQKRYPEAIVLLEKKLVLQQENLGKFNCSTIETMKMLLSTYLLTGQLQDAIDQAEQCLSLEEFTLGLNSKQSKRTKELLEGLRLSKDHPRRMTFQ